MGTKLPACLEKSLSDWNANSPETITAKPNVAKTKLNQKLILD